MFIPDKTVFISGIPEPSASAEIKYPTLVAIKKKAIADKIQNKKLKMDDPDKAISFLFSIPIVSN